MKRWKSNLDERQEQALLHIESRGFWLTWGGLLLAIILQLVLRPASLWALLPEWAVFMAMNLYIMVQCLRHNIWERRLQPNARTNAITACITGAVILPMVLATFWRNAGRVDGVIVLLSLLFAALPALLCFALLQALSAKYRRDKEQIENAPDGE